MIVAFDPVMGYRHHGPTGRSACVVFDEIQYNTTVKGNNYGFADADDFSPRRIDGVPQGPSPRRLVDRLTTL